MKVSLKTFLQPAQRALHLSPSCHQQQSTQTTISNSIKYNRHRKLPLIQPQNTSTGCSKLTATNKTGCCPCTAIVTNLCNGNVGGLCVVRLGTSSAAIKYTSKRCIAVIARSSLTSLRTPYRLTIHGALIREPLCKADFHSTACMPAHKSTVSVHKIFLQAQYCSNSS